MIKRFLAICLLCAVVLSALAACGAPNGTDDRRTLFIYMCGSNLETKQGLAGKNIDEILSADTGDLNIVIQTGGTKNWRSHDIDTRANQRYEVKGGELVLLDTLDQLDMGDPKTLTDFLSWGQENYPTSHNMLVLWDHGGGAAKGVCFDENYSFDPLSLTELRQALGAAKLKNKFELIGFDACLMASIETAAMVKDYADYMVASEEIEPSGGWDYKALCESFAKETAPLEVGKVICDSYMEKYKEKNNDLYATLSVFDLSYTDEMLKQVNVVTSDLIAHNIGSASASAVISAMSNCEKFGGGDTYQGTSNMLDLLDFVSEVVKNTSTNMTDVFVTTERFVPYTVNDQRNSAKGISFYYPVVYNEKEIRDYISLGISEDYNRFLSRLYLNVPKEPIAYTDRGSISDNGAFTVSLAPESSSYLSSIDYLLMETDDDGKQHILCTDNDCNKNWEDMIFKSNFRGICLALDGHQFFYSTVSNSDDYISFIAPVKVNGKRTNLRFIFMWDDSYFNGGYYMAIGTWSGYDENGLPNNDIFPLKEGDKVQVITDTVLDGKKTIENFSEEFTIGKDGAKITETPLDGKEYQYVFVATDIFNHTYTSDMATFEMTVSYDELLENPLPDETFAAKVEKIEPYRM